MFLFSCAQGKEVATAIVKLDEGTVVFEDVGIDRRRGKITRTLRTAHGRRASEPLAGRIVYETLEGWVWRRMCSNHAAVRCSPIEIPYGDKDQEGEYTLQPNDMVEFNIATDRRDRLQRATNITLVPETFVFSGEMREHVGVGLLKMAPIWRGF